MKALTFAFAVLAAFLTGAGCMTAQYAQYDRQDAALQDSAAQMTPQDVIDMSNAGAGDDVILDMIHKTGSVFPLTPQDVVALADSGVSSRVIRAMIKSGQAPRSSGGTVAYGYDPAWYWYPAYPLYYPWYFGYSARYYTPLYSHRYYAPHYYGFSSHGYSSHGYSPRGYSGGSRGYGGTRSIGRHR